MSKLAVYFLKLELFLFYLLIFSIPFQTRIVLRSWGIGFSEWNSAFLYGTDLLIIALLFLWFLRSIIHRSFFNFARYDWFLIGFLLVSGISIRNVSNYTFGFYQFLKLLEFSLLYFYVKSNIEIVFKLKTTFIVFLISGFFQALLAIIQFLKQSDLGLRVFGETVLNPAMFNVATFIVNGEKIMRAYGTLPHPNVLGLILLVSIFIFYWFYAERVKFFNSKRGFILYSIFLFGFFFTFSRIVIFAWAMVCLAGLAMAKKLSPKINFKKIVFATILVSVIFSALFMPYILARIKISTSDEAVVLRNFYNKVSLNEKPFWGVGIGNFVNWLKEINPGLKENIYQPVHNIYLLIFSETGIPGLVLFILFLIFLIKNLLKGRYSRRFYRYGVLAVFLSILFLGIFDHFLLTLQQGRLIFWMLLGFSSLMRSH